MLPEALSRYPLLSADAENSQTGAAWFAPDSLLPDLADLSTYLVTSVQLALAFPAESGGILASLAKFAGIFGLTQVPLAISEGLLTVLVWNWLQTYNGQELSQLRLLKKEG